MQRVSFLQRFVVIMASLVLAAPAFADDPGIQPPLPNALVRAVASVIHWLVTKIA